MKRAVITGATGVIGYALVTKLIARGVEVLVLTHSGSARNAIIPKHRLVTLMEADISGLDHVENKEETHYDVFFHLAWTGTRGAARDDARLQSDNIRYSVDAVRLASRLGCGTFVGIGSQAEYGRFEGRLSPDTPEKPETCYGIAKYAAGMLTREAAGRLGMKHIWVRVVSVYGPRDYPNTMVMSMIEKLRRGETPQLTKGEQMWDYLYSGDAAEALICLGEKGRSGKTYVLGSGQALPLQTYAQQIRDAVNPDAELALGAIPYAERQVMYLCAEISQITEDTGWRPETPFAEGIRKILENHEQSVTGGLGI